MNVGGIVLAGGKSRRMGQPKEWLTLRGETLLARIVRCVADVAQPIVVVGATDRVLPPLPDSVVVVHDEQLDAGPLEGLRVGFRTLGAREPPAIDAALVVSCDLPLLQPALLQLVIHSLHDEVDAAIPDDGQRLHPLVAAYRCRSSATLERVLATGSRRVLDFCSALRVHRIPVEELLAVDPKLESLLNANDPATWQHVQAREANE